MCESIPDPRPTSPPPVNPWANVNNVLANPSAEIGGGGPGKFRPYGATQDLGTANGLTDPVAPQTRTLDPIAVQDAAEELQAAAAAKKNPAPVVTADSTQKIGTVTVTTKKDLTGATGVGAALTRPTPTFTGEVSASTDAKGNVDVITNTVAYTLTIQSEYGTGKPDDKSAYGRGTTPDDVKNGDITLGFHESCHRADFVSWVKTKPVPKFTGKKGNTPAEFEKAQTDYEAAWDKYWEDMSTASGNATDEVGDPTRAKWKAANP